MVGASRHGIQILCSARPLPLIRIFPNPAANLETVAAHRLQLRCCPNRLFLATSKLVPIGEYSGLEKGDIFIASSCWSHQQVKIRRLHSPGPEDLAKALQQPK